MSDLIRRQDAIDALEKVAELYPWRVPGDRDSYSKYNEAWNDALDRAESEIEALPSAQPDLSGYSDKLWKAAYERGKSEAQQGWIPCSERLPEPRVAVLGYAPKFKNIFALYYDSVMGWMVWSPIRDDCLPNSQGDIIAWMPLPEPYAERRTDEQDSE